MVVFEFFFKDIWQQNDAKEKSHMQVEYLFAGGAQKSKSERVATMTYIGDMVGGTP